MKSLTRTFAVVALTVLLLPACRGSCCPCGSSPTPVVLSPGSTNVAPAIPASGVAPDGGGGKACGVGGSCGGGGKACGGK